MKQVLGKVVMPWKIVSVCQLNLCIKTLYALTSLSFQLGYYRQRTALINRNGNRSEQEGTEGN